MKPFGGFKVVQKALAEQGVQPNENLTELELATELGYSRIWDCGLFKYELT